MGHRKDTGDTLPSHLFLTPNTQGVEKFSGKKDFPKLLNSAPPEIKDKWVPKIREIHIKIISKTLAN